MKSYYFELEERLAKFAEEVVRLCRKLPQDAVNSRQIDQIIGSSGSTAANYLEACEAESGKDFIHKVKIAKKEIRESKFWLRLLGVSNEKYVEDFRKLYREADELLLILATIVRNALKKKDV